MSFLFFLLMMLACWLILWPAVKNWLIRKAGQHYADTLNSMFGRTAGQQQSAASKPAPKRKKIEKDVGEYVAFEEVTEVEQTLQPDGTVETEVYHEEQVTDIEWEDIKDDTTK